MRNKLCVEEKKLLYKSLVVPHIDYSSAILLMLNQSEINGLQKLQNRTMRIILKEDRYASVTNMLNVAELKRLPNQTIFVIC